jgi:hypothetical protein
MVPMYLAQICVLLLCAWCATVLVPAALIEGDALCAWAKLTPGTTPSAVVATVSWCAAACTRLNPPLLVPALPRLELLTAGALSPARTNSFSGHLLYLWTTLNRREVSDPPNIPVRISLWPLVLAPVIFVAKEIGPDRSAICAQST